MAKDEIIFAQRKTFAAVQPDLRIFKEPPLPPYGFDSILILPRTHAGFHERVYGSRGRLCGRALAFNSPVLSRKSNAPPFGDAMNRIDDSLRRLLQIRVRRIFPAQGEAFPADELWPLPGEWKGKENAHVPR